MQVVSVLSSFKFLVLKSEVRGSRTLSAPLGAQPYIQLYSRGLKTLLSETVRK